MKVHVLREHATTEQVNEMMEALQTVIKLAVDVEQTVIAGGGEWHADCEAELLKNGSRQEDIWGADWLPNTREVRFEALINIRPRQNNRKMEIQDTVLRSRIENIVRFIFESVQE